MDYGSAVAQKGYDVKTCADRFLVYSSAFQTLKVYSVSSVSGSVPGSGVNTLTVTHNLGYYAPYAVIYNGSGNNESNWNYFACETRQYTNSLQIDIPDYLDGSTAYFTVYIFLDNFSSIPQENINTSTTSGSSPQDYGIRISKSGYDVKTCTDEQCVLSNSFFNQIIHKKGNQSYTSGYRISHNLGYIPNFMTFSRPSGQSYITALTGAFTPGSVDSEYLYFDQTANSGRQLYYIIFKNKLI